MKLQNLSIRAKLFLVLGLLIAFLWGSLVLAYASTQAMDQQLETVFNVDHKDIVSAHTLLAKLNGVRALLVTLMSEEDAAAQRQEHEDIKALTRDIDTHFELLLEDDRHSDAAAASIRKAQEAWAAFRDTRDQELIPAVFADDLATARRLALGVQKTRYQTFVSEMEAFIEDENAGFEEVVQETHSATQQQQAIYLAVGVAALVLAVISAVGVGRIAAVIRQLADVAGRVAVGDTEQTTDHHSGDELGVLAESFRGLTSYVSGMADAALRISHGDMDVTAEPRSEQDVLSQSFNRMVNYISGIAQATGRLREGDLTVEVTPQSDKDDLSRNFNDAVEALRAMARGNKEAVATIGSASNETLAGVSQMTTSSQEQASAVSETSTTVEELRQSSGEVADRAKHVSEIARSASEEAEAGMNAIEETVNGVKRINERIESIARSILSLSEQTQAVGKITSSVNDIAEQSKMLAFNASIEAAKAGEFGKGFAVVATEIRSLAEQSKTATGQIAEILADIQKAANQSVMVTEEGTKEAERGLTLASNSGQRIREIADAIRTTAQTAVQIESATGQQARGMDQIVSAMSNIEESTTQVIASASQMEKAMQDITELSEQLNRSVAVYRLA